MTFGRFAPAADYSANPLDTSRRDRREFSTRQNERRATIADEGGVKGSPKSRLRGYPLPLALHPPSDGRVVARDHFKGAEALRLFRDPGRVEGSEMAAAHAGHVGWGFASGLVRRENGAMVLRNSDLIPLLR